MEPTKREAQTSDAVSKVQSRKRDGFGRLEGHAYYALHSVIYAGLKFHL